MRHEREENDQASPPLDSLGGCCGSAELARSINETIMMGNVGEMFSPLMYVLAQTYRIKREPSDPYDSMIFVTHAHPAQIKAQ